MVILRNLILLCFVAMSGVAEQLDLSKLPPPSPRQIDFVRDIQPILSERCYSCHGELKQESELRWDTKSSAFKGGASGKVIIPGKSSESRMIHLVAGLEKNLVMPKKGERLTAEQIGLLRAWIDQGANWPEQVALPTTKDKSDWWSFKPASRPDLPRGAAVSGSTSRSASKKEDATDLSQRPFNAKPLRLGKDDTAALQKNWARNEIDLFILAKLQEQKLGPSPEADRRTLIRRLSFDLTGLPPSPEEVEKFVSDKSPKAYEKLVDRLLASPRYGERWARHWLDVVHFGETHGYDKDKPRLNAWPYRDYVIRSLNSDKPYSKFVEEQLAGDVLHPDSPDGIVALGFIAAGPWDFVGHVELPIEKTDGLIARYNDRDDMVMTTISTFQSLTVHCARCHNHKFDPITQKDYYSLQSVFAGVDRADRNFDSDKSVQVKRRDFSQEKKLLENQLAVLTNQIARVSSPALEKLNSQLANLKSQSGVSDTAEKSPSNGYHSGIAKTPHVTKWVQVDLGAEKQIDQIRLVPARPVDFPNTPGFGFPLRFRVEMSDESEFKKGEILADFSGFDFKNPGDDAFTILVNKQATRFVRVTATKLWKRTDDYVFALAELQVFSNGTNVTEHAEVSALDSIEGGLWSKKFLVDGFSSRTKLKPVVSVTEQKSHDDLENQIQAVQEQRSKLVDSLVPPLIKKDFQSVTNRLGELAREISGLPPQQKVFAATSDFPPNGNFIPAKVPRPVHLLARGDVTQPRDLMRAAGVASVAGPNPEFEISDTNNEGARRAALAKWITDPKNMLTRRSIVNRVWQYHFERGIVETANDFGHMGALPTHPELLDWLAFWFLENGESLKTLHRLIVTSATYRQSSSINPDLAKLDADNRFLWRMNCERLDAESIRDSMLLISGKLDLAMGGPSIQQFGFKDDHSPVYDYTQFDGNSAAACRRSIYSFTVRSAPDPLMESLDCPDASILAPKRNVTMTSLQALAVLNNPFVLKQCANLASRVSKSGDLKIQVAQAFQLSLNRAPTADEMKKLIPFAEKNGMENFCRLLFNLSEFMFVD